MNRLRELDPIKTIAIFLTIIKYLMNLTNNKIKRDFSFLHFVYSCKQIDEKLGKIPPGTMVPSLIFSVLGIFLGNITNLLGVTLNTDFIISFFMVYVLFLLLQILSVILYISAEGFLRKYFIGDILNFISTIGIYFALIFYIFIIITQVFNIFYLSLMILSIIIICIIFYTQSFKSLIKTIKILKRAYEQCLKLGPFKNCKGCKLKK